MYIEPNSTIRLLKNCPLDTSYDHTIWFANKNNQTDYFMGLTKNYGRTNEFSFSKQYYARATKGSVRLQKSADECFDCNYMMFRNTSYGNKWFYAYIVSIDFINNITCQINFEIDPIQTWYFDFTLGECFVEREHAEHDRVGLNLVPENLDLGDYVSENPIVPSYADGTPLLSELSIVVACTFDEDYHDAYGGYFAGTFTGLNFITFPNTVNGAEACNDFIANSGAKSEGIVCVFLMPTCMLVNENQQAKQYDFTVPQYKTSIGLYEPKNKKLFTYPYNFLYVTNLQGNSAEYHYEYFSDVDDCTFSLTGDMSCNPSVIISPTNYKGVTNNFDEKLTLTGYPQLPYSVDTFKVWLAQNASNIGVTALSTGITAAMAVGTFGASTVAAEIAGMSSVNSVMNLLNTGYKSYIRPPQASGQGGNQTLAVLSMINFACYQKHIRPEFAKIIDEYFTMFGYATHRVKVPNTHVRSEWTYTKTINCVVHGSVPADDMKKICNIFNNGITFWVNPNHIGDYYRDNDTLTP